MSYLTAVNNLMCHAIENGEEAECLQALAWGLGVAVAESGQPDLIGLAVVNHLTEVTGLAEHSRPIN